jgi:hypothetical protein
VTNTTAHLQFPLLLESDPNFPACPEVAAHHACLETNAQLRHSCIDDSGSGTTAVAAILQGSMLTVVNVGDSRAVLAVRTNGGLVAKDLSWDQTPMRSDECERVKAYGTRVLSAEQLDGFKDLNTQDWTSQVCSLKRRCLISRSECYRGNSA